MINTSSKDNTFMINQPNMYKDIRNDMSFSKLYYFLDFEGNICCRTNGKIVGSIGVRQLDRGERNVCLVELGKED